MSLVIVAALLASVPPCAAGDIRVDWVRGESARECPDGQAVADEISARLGCTAFGDSPLARFEVLVTKAKVGWAAQVQTYDATGTLLGRRVLETNDEACRALLGSVALEVVLAAESLGVDTATKATAAPPPRIEPIGMRVIYAATTTITEAQPIIPRERGAAEFGAVMNSGTLSSVRAGAYVAARWRPLEPLNVAVGMMALPVERDDVFGFGLVAGWAEGCYRPLDDFVSVDLCARVLGGAVIGIVYEREAFKNVNPGSYTWWAGAPILRATAMVWSPLLLVLEGGPVVSFVRSRFEVDGEPVLDSGPIALQASVGLGIRLD